MIKIEFTPEEVDLLESERYRHPDPRVQKKMEAVYLKSQEIAHQEICRDTTCARKTCQVIS
jgi:hypothetical protein